MWFQHLNDIGIPNDFLNTITNGCDLNVRNSFHNRLKLLMVLWLEYEKSWMKLEAWIGQNFNKFEYQSAMDSSAYDDFRYDVQNRTWFYKDEEVLPSFITLQGTGTRFRQNWKLFTNLFPFKNPLFNIYLRELENNFRESIVKKTSKIKDKRDLSSFIVKEWYNF